MKGYIFDNFLMKDCIVIYQVILFMDILCSFSASFLHHVVFNPKFA